MATVERSKTAAAPVFFQLPWSAAKQVPAGEAVGGDEAVVVVMAPAEPVLADPPRGRALPLPVKVKRRSWGKLSTQYDSDTNVFQNKLSSKLWRDRVKLKATWDFWPSTLR